MKDAHCSSAVCFFFFKSESRRKFVSVWFKSSFSCVSSKQVTPEIFLKKDTDTLMTIWFCPG